MSRAFVKEDIEPPERSRRPRAASGLPPGAANYMTARSAKRLTEELSRLDHAAAADQAKATRLRDLLASVTVVEPIAEPDSIAFGAKVTVRDASGELRSYRIVGVDEIEFYPDAVSWISPLGKTLLAAEPGGRVIIEGDQRGEIVAVSYPAD